MAQNSSAQMELQKEIDEVIGESCFPTLADRPLMPYADAVLNELLRLSSITPLGGPHRATRDMEFHGYNIPKDTMVFANVYGVHHDPAVYKDPDSFIPERFLGDEGNILRREAFCPFSTGKRSCEKRKQYVIHFNFQCTVRAGPASF